MATYPVSNLRGTFQGVVGTGVKEEVINRPEGVRAYTRSSGGYDKPWKSIILEVADWICGHELVSLHARHYCLPSRNKSNRDNHPPYRDHSLKNFDPTTLVNFHDPIKINEKRDRNYPVPKKNR